MSFDKPSVLARYFLGSLWFIFLILLLVLQLAFNVNVRWEITLPISIFIGIGAYFVLSSLIERFIHNKVKLIYKNIHDLKIGKDLEENNLVRTTDLNMVSEEVEEWTKKQSAEIENLRESENFRREFIGSVSHELRTPVFNIQGYLLTLLDGGLDDPDINRSFLKKANKSVDRMIAIIDDLAKISNLESNRVQISPMVFNIVDLAKEVIELVEDKSEERKTKIVFKKEYDRPIEVQADRSKVEQVFINLITNAIKYGKQGGQIEIRFYDMHHQILTEVADDGVGIPQADLPRVFERFYRVDKSRARDAGGTGLGLAIVKHIIEAHKQTINVRSSVGVGSTFSFTLKKA